MARPRTDTHVRRPVLYQICRAGEQFEVGDGPFDLSTLQTLVLGRGAEGGYDTHADEDTVRVTDPWMSGRHAVLHRGNTGWRLEDQGSTNGVLVNGRRVDSVALDNGDLLETGRTFWVYTLLGLEPALPVEPVTFGPMATWHAPFAQALTALGRHSLTNQPVLLTGEPGTGKAFAARAIHQASGRVGRFLEVDCAHLPPQRLAQELFGAQDPRAGAVNLSNSGTLYVHRVELLPMEVQELLATALETGRITSMAGSRAFQVDLRLVASAEADLDTLVQKGRCSPRLRTLLTAASFTLPPLRQRREDLGLLMESLLERADGARTVTRDACRALLNYPWPRNTRELSKVLEGGAILAQDEGAVDLRHLPGVVAMRSGLVSVQVDEGAAPMVTGELSQLAPVPSALLDAERTTDGIPDDNALGVAASHGLHAEPTSAEPMEVSDASLMEVSALEVDPLLLEEAAADLAEGLPTDADQEIPAGLRAPPRAPPVPPPPAVRRSATHREVPAARAPLRPTVGPRPTPSAPRPKGPDKPSSPSSGGGGKVIRSRGTR